MWKRFQHSNKVMVGICATYTILHNNTCALWSPWDTNKTIWPIHYICWMLELRLSGWSTPTARQTSLTLMTYWSSWIYKHRPLSMQWLTTPREPWIMRYARATASLSPVVLLAPLNQQVNLVFFARLTHTISFLVPSLRLFLLISWWRQWRQTHMCLNCLRPGLFVKQCKSLHECREWQKLHHSLLHIDSITSSTVSPTPLNPLTHVSSITATGLKSNILHMTCQASVTSNLSITTCALLHSGWWARVKQGTSFVFEHF